MAVFMGPYYSKGSTHLTIPRVLGFLVVGKFPPPPVPGGWGGAQEDSLNAGWVGSPRVWGSRVGGVCVGLGGGFYCHPLYSAC